MLSLIYRLNVGVFCVGVAVWSWTGWSAVTPNAFNEGSDSDRIEAAIAKAVETGERSIEIPRMNAKSGQPIWLIERAILLPSNFTLLLRDSLVRLAPGTQDNLIRNAGTSKEPMEENENIRILGIGNAMLSGGTEAHFDPPGDRSGWPTIGVLLCGVKYFTIEGLTLEETQAWAISVENGCAFGRIANLHFKNTAKYPNQDGVDIRKGCHDILIENITGELGDDAVALTALRSDKPPTPGRKSMQIGGKKPRENDNIYNITIRNVRVKTPYHMVMLLCHDGIKLYNIFISDIMDASEVGDRRRTNAGVKLGESGYSSMSRGHMGDISNISVNNVLTRGKRSLWVRAPLQNAVLRNIMGYDGCTNVVEISAPTSNVVFDAKQF
ncbi:MAG: glycosyl hydrolase family 28 protein [Kiritimatiellia bacterium]